MGNIKGVFKGEPDLRIQRLRILSRYLKCWFRNVAKHNLQCRMLQLQGDPYASRSSPQIKHPRAIRQRRRQGRESFDQNLRLLARNQHIRSDPELAPIELPIAKNVCKRLQSQPPLQQRLRRLGHVPLRMGKDLTSFPPKRMRGENLGLELGRLNTGVGKPLLHVLNPICER